MQPVHSAAEAASAGRAAHGRLHDPPAERTAVRDVRLSLRLGRGSLHLPRPRDQPPRAPRLARTAMPRVPQPRRLL